MPWFRLFKVWGTSGFRSFLPKVGKIIAQTSKKTGHGSVILQVFGGSGYGIGMLSKLATIPLCLRMVGVYLR